MRRLTPGTNRFAYQDIFTELPQSLRHLEIRHAHGPDVNVIVRVKRFCPRLETLWLGRCTMFNRTPACQFWESFPFDHDSYISSEGTDAYAVSTHVNLIKLFQMINARVLISTVLAWAGTVSPSTLDNPSVRHLSYALYNSPSPQTVPCKELACTTHYKLATSPRCATIKRQSEWPAGDTANFRSHFAAPPRTRI